MVSKLICGVYHHAPTSTHCFVAEEGVRCFEGRSSAGTAAHSAWQAYQSGRSLDYADLRQLARIELREWHPYSVFLPDRSGIAIPEGEAGEMVSAPSQWRDDLSGAQTRKERASEKSQKTSAGDEPCGTGNQRMARHTVHRSLL